ncbi:zw18 protein, putative [Ichthyophthirius multifiliis]|uniref:Zw18 protein, putative n=1 Tax=Ichthyophthirius multifiliis TaxID=5932 RepID=G0QU58_ICHMU|nr:zw18 protein, putative [Ichthyophthirius multifiliis]EGR31239.1 zw18 protein, putative [Ichthyophthirius multifiliis]|eukprot:XP_004034725.1 zw18 protein, putative [Ichthyophthirius multifiliis]
MRLIANILSIHFPECIILNSQSNQYDTNGDINQMGKKLAQEIRQFIESQFIFYNKQLKRLSFIGHSLGGVLIRAALVYLQDLSQYFYIFITLSSPHLGFQFSQSKLIDAGLWVLKIVKKALSLKQLSMTDQTNIYDTFIYQLSCQNTISQFQHIILVSSPQDLYVPYYSARMQYVEKQEEDQNQQKISLQMLNNIFKNVQVQRIHRIDVSFTILGKNIDNYIGKTAHIMFLDNQEYLNIIFSHFKELFS